MRLPKELPKEERGDFKLKEKKVEHYHLEGIEACEIMDLVKPPKSLKGSQVHSFYNLIKRIRRFGKKDSIEVEAKKITEEFNHIITGKYR